MNARDPSSNQQPSVLFDDVVPSARAMEELGARLARVVRAGDLVVLDGPLGAGKTTLTRGLGAAMGARGQVSSPTFVLARTHPTSVGPDLVHVDAYRLSEPAELDDLDLDWDAAVVVVEWGHGMVDGISDSVLDIEIIRPTGAGRASTEDPDAVPDEPRRVIVTATGARWRSIEF